MGALLSLPLLAVPSMTTVGFRASLYLDRSYLVARERPIADMNFF